ncbi:MAG TPA: hypothetical protein GXZ52_01535 [Clostridiales bacterium]|nr:hypothetical protein [Clostridiales bacterium]
MMAYTSFYKGIAFVEGGITNAKVIRPNVSAKLGGFGSHLKTLADVKDILVEQCISSNANAVINFKYGQKTKLFAIDDMVFYGSGDLAVLDQQTLQELHEKFD